MCHWTMEGWKVIQTLGKMNQLDYLLQFPESKNIHIYSKLPISVSVRLTACPGFIFCLHLYVPVISYKHLDKHEHM